MKKICLILVCCVLFFSLVGCASAFIQPEQLYIKDGLVITDEDTFYLVIDENLDADVIKKHLKKTIVIGTAGQPYVPYENFTAVVGAFVKEKLVSRKEVSDFLVGSIDDIDLSDRGNVYYITYSYSDSEVLNDNSIAKKQTKTNKTLNDLTSSMLGNLTARNAFYSFKINVYNAATGELVASSGSDKTSFGKPAITAGVMNVIARKLFAEIRKNHSL